MMSDTSMQHLWTWLARTRLIKAVEETINGAINSSTPSKEALQKLDGQTLAIQINPPDISFVLRVFEQRLQVTRDTDSNAHLSISGSPISLAKLALAADKQSVIESEPLHIEGGTSSLYAWQKFFATLHIEWEFELAKRTGPIPARILVSSLQTLRKQAQQAMTSLDENAGHALVWNDLAVPESELKSFSNRSHELRSRVETLHMRLQNLKKEPS